MGISLTKVVEPKTTAVLMKSRLTSRRKVND